MDSITNFTFSKNPDATISMEHDLAPGVKLEDKKGTKYTEIAKKIFSDIPHVKAVRITEEKGARTYRVDFGERETVYTETVSKFKRAKSVMAIFSQLIGEPLPKMPDVISSRDDFEGDMTSEKVDQLVRTRADVPYKLRWSDTRPGTLELVYQDSSGRIQHRDITYDPEEEEYVAWHPGDTTAPYNQSDELDLLIEILLGPLPHMPDVITSRADFCEGMNSEKVHDLVKARNFPSYQLCLSERRPDAFVLISKDEHQMLMHKRYITYDSAKGEYFAWYPGNDKRPFTSHINLDELVAKCHFWERDDFRLNE